MKTVLSIAGSDPSGGAGIQADIKTITSHKSYAMSVITALTAQNTTGVFSIEEASAEFVGMQLDAVFSDIFPDAVKVGMVSNASIITEIAQKLKKYEAKNIVVDPVMVATSGGKLIQDNATMALSDLLFPLSTLITPNIPEAEALTRCKINNKDDMEKSAEILFQKYNTNILIKGGHFDNCSDDLLYDGKEFFWIRGKRIDTKNTHGTGCTLSSAIACGLAKNLSLKIAVEKAKAYVFNAISNNISLGKGNGPINHCWNIK